MERMEVPLENVQEYIHEAVHKDHKSVTHKSSLSFSLIGALMSAILAVFAAISSLMAGHYINEAMISQIKSSDQWGYYQAKGIKASVSEIKVFLSPKDNPQNYSTKIEEYKKEQVQIKDEAERYQVAAEEFLHKHNVISKAVTFFQIAIALTAIAVLSRRKEFLWISSGLCFVGFYFLISGFLG